jgi:hypothetical protein
LHRSLDLRRRHELQLKVHAAALFADPSVTEAALVSAVVPG